MNRRTFVSSAIALCVGAIFPRKQKETISQQDRIRKLLKGTVDRHPKGWRPFVASPLSNPKLTYVFWDSLEPDSNGMYYTSLVSIWEATAQQMNDDELEKWLLITAKIVAVNYRKDCGG